MIPIYPEQPYITIPPNEQGIITIPCTLPNSDELSSPEQNVIPASFPFLYKLRVYQIFHNACYANQSFYLRAIDKLTGYIDAFYELPSKHVRGSTVNGSFSVKSPPLEDWSLSMAEYMGVQYGKFLPLAQKLVSDKIELYTHRSPVDSWVTVTNPYNGLDVEIFALGENQYYYHEYFTNITIASRWILYGQYRHYRKKAGSIVPLLAGFMLPLLAMLGAAGGGGTSSTNQHQQQPAGRRRKTK